MPGQPQQVMKKKFKKKKKSHIHFQTIAFIIFFQQLFVLEMNRFLLFFLYDFFFLWNLHKKFLFLFFLMCSLAGSKEREKGIARRTQKRKDEGNFGIPKEVFFTSP